MSPILSWTDCEANELRCRDLWDEAASRRRADEVPVTDRRHVWGGSRRRTLTVLLGLGLLTLLLLRPWTGEHLVVAEIPPEVTVAAGNDSHNGADVRRLRIRNSSGSHR